MNNETGKSILPFKVEQLLELIMEKKQMSSVDALYYLYTSDLYNSLPVDDTKHWLSAPALYELSEPHKISHFFNTLSRYSVGVMLNFCLKHLLK